MPPRTADSFPPSANFKMAGCVSTNAEGTSTSFFSCVARRLETRLEKKEERRGRGKENTISVYSLRLIISVGWKTKEREKREREEEKKEDETKENGA